MSKKKVGHKKICVRIGAIIILLGIIGFLMSGILYYGVMNKHIDTYENSKGLAKFLDYQEIGLERKESNFISDNGDKLNGYFYSNSEIYQYKGVIIVNNGFGSGHEAMLGEIQALSDCGYLVYGFDKTGYDNSEGKGIGSLSQGVDDLLKAIEHVKKVQIASGLDIILYGKSYGAYCCLAALNKTDDVAKVIAISAFNRTSDMLESEGKRMIGNLSIVFLPVLKVYDWMNEKEYIACEGIVNTDADVLIMHSKDDSVVSYQQSFLLFKEKTRENANINFILYEDRGHDIIKSNESIQYIEQMNSDLQVFVKSHDDNMTDGLWEEFLSNYDLKISTQPDKDIIYQVVSFLNE